MSVECITLIENNEEFIESNYNGIKIYVRKSDGFVNVSKMCSDANRDFHTFKRGERYRKIENYYINEECKGRQNCRTIYILKKGYNLMQGQWMIPDLIHFVAEWISIPYSFIVKRIMDKINEIGQLKQLSFEENTNEIITNLENEITELKNKNKELQEHIKETSVPIDNCDKDLYLIVEGERLIISANSSKPPEFFDYHFTFPASINIKQLLREEFGVLKKLKADRLSEVIEYINGFEPK